MIQSPGSTATPASTVAAHAIPFRAESHSLGGQALGVLGMLTLLLMVGLALALVARKMGWLERWIVRRPVPGERAVGLHVDATLRINARTTVYGLSDAHGRYLLVESGAHARLTVLAPRDRASVDG